ncbi:MAG: hypothetical protein IJD92_01955 [Bacilli bacterium]|nr:hypothetical protein [Bacilli bacterium]
MKKKTLYIIIILLYVICIFRISYLMFIKSSYYKELLSLKNNRIIYGTSAPRGRIIDTNGNIIVDNIGIKTIVYNKLSGISIKDEIDIALKLANILDIEEANSEELKYFYYLNNKEKINSLVSQDIMNKYKERKIESDELLDIRLSLISNVIINNMSSLEKRAANIFNIMNNGYNYQDKIIKSNCNDKEYSLVIESNLPGVRTELTFERINNYDGVLSEVIGKVGLIPLEELEYYKSKGYSNNDIVGISYLEKYYEDYLKGTKAQYKVNNDNTISLVSDAIQGNDLILNIDIELQKNIESILESEIKKAKEFKSSKYYNGSYIIISDPNTGGIVSLVGKSYNNGIFYNNEIGNINKSYTVGSVVKAATISIGYKYNIIDIGDSVVDSCVKLKNKLPKCSWKSLGKVNDLSALAQSSNYYQFLIAIGLTGEKYKYNMSLNNLDYAFKIYRDTLSEYGLGVKTGIDLENESIGIIGKTISDDLLLNLSIGQYDTYTPIELTQYINTVANNGSRIKLSLMKEIVNSEGKVILENESNILNEVELDSIYKDRIKEGLKKVGSSGTGSSYINQKYNASSKTGTSESILDSDMDGISDTFATTRTFVSYMPSDDPVYSLVIVSPNIDYKENDNVRTYPINIYLARQISEILFAN